MSDRINCRAEATEAQLLIIDPHPEHVLEPLRRGPSAAGYRLATAPDGAVAIERLLRDTPSVVLLDPQLPDRCGLALHRDIRRLHPRVPVIFVTHATAAETAITAMKQGAFDYLSKPVDGPQLWNAVTAAIDAAQDANRPIISAARSPASETDGALCGACPMMREVYKSVGRVAAQDVNVLITGESGTGKELVARAIVQHSSRMTGPFLALNCAAIPENLLESELFGHEKGAFSGADRRRIGKFEQCNGGTILLDEIGDMPPGLQAKILRLVQEQTFERVGGSETIQTDVRVIASTHRDLAAWSAQGKFRGDLYYRLSVFTIHLPPLRERGEDIPMLARHLLRRYSRELGREAREIADEAMERLQQYHWPGNIRELQSVLKQALLRSHGQVLSASCLPALSDASPDATVPSPPTSTSDFDLDRFLRQRMRPDACDLYSDLHRELDRHALARVLTYTRGNRFMAARVLGIARQTLRLKLRESGLHVTHSVESEDDEVIRTAPSERSASSVDRRCVPC
jgi:two-component system nitrogen regulation response regulator GlnG